MADIKQDLLGLQYSQSFSIEGLQEQNIELNLAPPPATAASLYGQVTDGTNPIANATVKLFDSQGVPYQHTMTDSTGNYAFDGVPAGTYSLAAVKTGYLLSDAVGVTLSASDTTEINLACTADVTLSLGAIAGIMPVEGEQLLPLAGAKITLMNASGQAVASTYSANDGEFVFYDVADGVYTLLASAEGYLASAPVTATITGGSLVNLTMSMHVDSRTYNGTVSGTISDQNGMAVAGCFVGLYSIVGGKEVLIATTKTNDMGKYLFGGVTGGQYLVKAKLEQ